MLSDPPKLHELDLIESKGQRVRVIEAVAGKWDGVALRLHFEHSDITIIERDCHYQSVRCCQTVFSQWLDGKGRKPVTWEVLIKAVSEAGFSEVAKDLTSIFNS